MRCEVRERRSYFYAASHVDGAVLPTRLRVARESLDGLVPEECKEPVHIRERSEAARRRGRVRGKNAWMVREVSAVRAFPGGQRVDWHVTLGLRVAERAGRSGVAPRLGPGGALQAGARRIVAVRGRDRTRVGAVPRAYHRDRGNQEEEHRRTRLPGIAYRSDTGRSRVKGTVIWQ